MIQIGCQKLRSISGRIPIANIGREVTRNVGGRGKKHSSKATSKRRICQKKVEKRKTERGSEKNILSRQAQYRSPSSSPPPLRPPAFISPFGWSPEEETKKKLEIQGMHAPRRKKATKKTEGTRERERKCFFLYFGTLGLKKKRRRWLSQLLPSGWEQCCQVFTRVQCQILVPKLPNLKFYLLSPKKLNAKQ